MPDAVILLPPSEGKAAGGRARGRLRVPRSFPPLVDARAEAVAALEAAMDDAATASGLLGVKTDALAEARTANLTLATSPVLPAIERYTGVLYDHLGAASLDDAARARLDEEVVIVSGLWGLVRPTDPLPDYKLKIDASLAPLGRMSTWWRNALTPVLDRTVRGRVVWDLLPNAHAAVWQDPERTPALRVTAAFAAEQRKGADVVRTAVTHWSKALKGALARHLLSSPTIAPDRASVVRTLEAFDHPQGYALVALEGDGRQLHASFLAPLAGG